MNILHLKLFEFDSILLKKGVIFIVKVDKKQERKLRSFEIQIVFIYDFK